MCLRLRPLIVNPKIKSCVEGNCLPALGSAGPTRAAWTESHLSYLSETPFRLRSEREGKGRKQALFFFFFLFNIPSHPFRSFICLI